MEHKFNSTAVDQKLAESGQHSASRAAVSNYRIGSISNDNFACMPPDQIDLRIRGKLIVDCPMDLNPGQIALTAAFSSSLSLSTGTGRSRPSGVITRRRRSAPITPTQRPQPMHNPAWTISSVVRTLAVNSSPGHVFRSEELA